MSKGPLYFILGGSRGFLNTTLTTPNWQQFIDYSPSVMEANHATGELYDELRPYVSKYLTEIEALPLDDPHRQILDDRGNLAKMIWWKSAVRAGFDCAPEDYVDGEEVFRKMRAEIAVWKAEAQGK